MFMFCTLTIRLIHKRLKRLVGLESHMEVSSDPTVQIIMHSTYKF